MEKCIFCGTTRKSSPQVRFFAVPREPGLKRIQWLFVLGDREIGPKDRICGLHFRSGRPSSDPSHEDFVPHLYLNRDPPEEILNYLESLDDSEGSGQQQSNHDTSMGRDQKPSHSINLPSSHSGKGGRVAQSHSMLRAVSKPSILQRKRRTQVGGLGSIDGANDEARLSRFERAATKIHILQKSIAEAVGARHGQRVIIKRMVPVVKKKASTGDDQTAATED